MTRCFTIAVDCDDVIENLVDAWCMYLDNKYDLTVIPEDITDWEIIKFFPTLTSEQIFEPLHLEEFWKTVKPKEDAIEYLRKLIKEKHQDIYIVTNSSFDTINWKVKYVIKKYFPFINEKNIIVCAKKQLIKCDIMIDDNIDNLENGSYWKLLYNCPHNQQVNLNYYYCDKKIKRVNNWKEIYETIKYLDWFYTATNIETIGY